MSEADIQIAIAVFSVLPKTPPESLGEKDRLRLEGMTSASRRAAFIAGRQLVVRMVPEVLPRLQIAPSGKPRTSGESGLELSIAHSGQRVVCAVSCDATPIGVDLERRRSRLGLYANPEEIFHPDEIAWLQEGDPATFDARFFQLWTMKEAVVKAEGVGTSAFRRFSVLRGDVCDWPEVGCVWQCRHWALPGGWDLAIAWPGVARRQIHLETCLADGGSHKVMNIQELSDLSVIAQYNL